MLNCIYKDTFQTHGKIVQNKRVQVSFTDKQWEIISHFKGEFGDTDADVIRNIVLCWLSEKSLITSFVKKRVFCDK